jgi:hypothetical protein
VGGIGELYHLFIYAYSIGTRYDYFLFSCMPKHWKIGKNDNFSGDILASILFPC